MTEKQTRYAQQMRELGFAQARLWMPPDAFRDWSLRAAADRIDYLQAIVESAPDGDPRLVILAAMNRAAALSARDKASLRQTASNLAKLDAALADLDAIEAVMSSAIKAAESAESAGHTGAAIRHHARATVAAMDYRHHRNLLLGGAD
jgi:hypothetical protein